MRKLSLLLVVMLGIVLVAGACSSDSNGSTTPSGDGTGGGGGSSSLTVTASEFAFDPDGITVSTGEEVTIVFANDGSIRHDFTSESLGIDTDLISGGDSVTITFTPSEAGEFEFICSVPGHAQSGMMGTITVTG